MHKIISGFKVQKWITQKTRSSRCKQEKKNLSANFAVPTDHNEKLDKCFDFPENQGY